MANTIEALQGRFSADGRIRFEEGAGGLVRAIVNAPAAKGEVFLYGGHVSAYQPAGQRPVLFLSGRSVYEVGKPIRGGVPICFPWFGPRAGDASAPLHGFARVQTWEMLEARAEGDGVALTLGLRANPQTRAIWDYDFELRYRVSMGSSLTLALAVHNRDQRPMKFDEALHTYFAVQDVRSASIEGLAGADYLDKTDGMKRKKQDASPIRMTGETDRVYINTSAATMIHDPGNSRLVIEKTGSQTTVVWNPWIAKAKAMADFGDEEWASMVCVETANAMENAVTLAPAGAHEMVARIKTG